MNAAFDFTHHRILVTGERVMPTPAEDLAAAGSSPDVPGFPWWAVALGGIVTGLGIYIWRTGYTTAPVAARRKDETAAPEHSEYEDSTSLEF